VTSRALLVVAAVTLAACPAPRPPPVTPLPPSGGNGKITWIHASTANEVPHAPPEPGTYRLHLIDVGTGLAILIQGADFAMLYDAGTNDKEEKPSRVTAYLAAALGPSGDDLCGSGAPGTKRTIENVVLSHPHFDHASALDLVLHCYEVHQFWDSGRVNPTVFYRELLSAIGQSTGLTYHTAADVPDNHDVSVKDTTIHIPTWQRFSEGDTVQLGAGAKFTILHAEAKALKDPNQNSVVIAVELGSTHVLLVGDAESGERRDPSYPVGDVEEFLLDHHKAEIKADILQVGHHGSKTSSRRDFLAAVHAQLALVSSGPKRYGKTVLPDHEVLDELKAQGATILRTDEHDDGCPESGKIGGDDGPGGCDSWVITIK
jgi:competence protein ComEC